MSSDQSLPQSFNHSMSFIGLEKYHHEGLMQSVEDDFWAFVKTELEGADVPPDLVVKPTINIDTRQPATLESEVEILRLVIDVVFGGSENLQQAAAEQTVAAVFAILGKGVEYIKDKYKEYYHAEDEQDSSK